MSVSLNVCAYSSVESPEFKKHLSAVKFCIENKLSYPKETSEFFKGKCGGDNLEDITPEFVLEYIENGIEVPLTFIKNNWESEIIIKVCDIPSEADILIVSLS